VGGGAMTLSTSWLLSLYIDDFPHPHIAIHIQIELSQGPNVSVLWCGFSGGWMGGWMPSVCVSARRQSILIKFHPLAEKQKRKEKENIIKMCSNFSLVFSTD